MTVDCDSFLVMLQIDEDNYILIQIATDCCKMLQIAKDSYILLQMPTDSYRFLLIATDCQRLLQIATDFYKLRLYGMSCNLVTPLAVRNQGAFSVCTISTIPPITISALSTDLVN